MLSAKILAEILPEAHDIERLESLLALEMKYEVRPLALRRLAALLPESGEIATLVAQRLKMSKRGAAKLHRLATLPALMHGKLDPVLFRHASYLYGAEDALDAALLLAATEPASDLEPIFAAVAAWDDPHFPLQGQDLMALGMKQGPAMGKLLKEIEESWIAGDFRLTREECLALAKGKLSA
jgi:poly(A) polymerase